MEQSHLRTIRIDPHQVEVFAPADCGELLHRRELLCKYVVASAPDPVRSVSSTIAPASVENTLTYSIPVGDLLSGDGRDTAPCAIFPLGEGGVMIGINAVLQRWRGHCEVRDIAGIHQLYRLDDPADTLNTLRR